MKTLLKYIFSFFSFLSVTFFILYLSFFSSFNSITSNVEKSQLLFKQETMYPKIDNVIYTNILDNYTDSLMINIAVTNKEHTSILEKTAGSYYWDLPKGADSQINWTDSAIKKNTTIESYARYWHGYLIVLKPLLTIFSYSEIRTINLLGQVGISLIIAILLFKRKNILFSLSFLGTFIFFIPNITGKSLQYSTVIYPTYIAIIYLLWKYKYLSDFSLRNIYLILGMSIAFFDLLTFPIVSLVYLLSFDLILHKKENMSESFLNIIKKGILWGCGYFGMWFAKWILASLIMRENIIKEAINRIFLRTGDNVASTHKITYSNVISETFIYLPKRLILLYLLIYTIILIIFIKYNNTYFSKSLLYENITLITISTFPLIWFFITKNHSMIHSFFTYRNYAAVFLPIIFFITSSFRHPE